MKKTASIVRVERLRGFSLVEVMVGLTIGVIAVLLISQMVVLFDRQKRGNAGSADIQNTGAIALYTIDSDVKQAGYGLASMDSLYCTFQTDRNFNGRPFVPVMIIPAGMAKTAATNVLGIPPGDAGSDIVAVMYSNTAMTPEGVPISGSTTTTYSFSKNVTGFAINDYVLVAQDGQPCTVGRVTSITSPTITINHSSTGATYLATAANAFNIGSNGLTMRVYAVRNGNLTVCDYWNNDCSTDLSGLTGTQTNALWVPIASNVIALRAQYGWDTSATSDMRVDAFCRSRLTSTVTACPVPDDGMTSPATVPNTACDWTRIVSLRTALVLRSTEKAPSVVSPPTIELWPSVVSSSGTNPVPLTSGPLFGVPDQTYRYKVFNTITPIRNVIWLGAQSSC